MSAIELAGITSLPAIAYLLYLSIGGVYFTSPLIATLTILNAISAGITQILNAPHTYHGEQLIMDARNIIIVSTISFILIVSPLLAPTLFSYFFAILTPYPIATPILLAATSILVSYVNHLSIYSSLTVPKKEVDTTNTTPTVPKKKVDMSDNDFLRKPKGWRVSDNEGIDTSKYYIHKQNGSDEDESSAFSSDSGEWYDDSLTSQDPEHMLKMQYDDNDPNNFRTPTILTNRREPT